MNLPAFRAGPNDVVLHGCRRACVFYDVNRFYATIAADRVDGRPLLLRVELKTIQEYIPKDESLQKLPIYKVVTDDEFFATTGIPTTFIINSSGDLIVKDVGSAFWNDQSVFNFIDNLLGIDEV